MVFVPVVVSTNVRPTVTTTTIGSNACNDVLGPNLMRGTIVTGLTNIRVASMVTGRVLTAMTNMVITTTMLAILTIILGRGENFTPRNRTNISRGFNVGPLFTIVPLIPIVVLLLNDAGLMPTLRVNMPRTVIVNTVLSLTMAHGGPIRLAGDFFSNVNSTCTGVVNVVVSMNIFMTNLGTLKLVGTLVG